jgi:hypothetical protein
MTSPTEAFSREIIRQYHEMMEQRAIEEENFRLRLHGTITGRIPDLYQPEMFPPFPPPMHREMVVDGIPSSRVNAEGVSTNTHQPMVCIKDEEQCGEHCGTCSSDVQYNKDYWASREMYWSSQMHEFGVEWDPDIVF